MIGLAAFPILQAGSAGGILLVPAMLALACSGVAYWRRRSGLLVLAGACLIGEYLAWLLLTVRPVEWMSPLIGALLFVSIDLGGRVIESARAEPSVLLSARSLGELMATALLAAILGAALVGLAAVALPGGLLLAALGAAAAVLTVWLVAIELHRATAHPRSG
jgi:hypothetical protein